MNITIMLCRLVKDVELKKINTNKGEMSIAKFSVATPKRYKKEGESDANFYDCQAFGKTAEVIEKYLSKGSQVLLKGTFENNNYTDKDGNKRYGFIFNVESMDFTGTRNTNNSSVDNTSSSGTEEFMKVDDNPDGLPFN